MYVNRGCVTLSVLLSSFRSGTLLSVHYDILLEDHEDNLDIIISFIDSPSICRSETSKTINE